MKIELQRKGLATMMRLMRFTEKATSRPILNHALIETVGTEAIRIAATDGEISVSGTCPAVVQKQGRIVVPIKSLRSIVDVMPDGTVSIGTNRNSVDLSSGKSMFKLITLDAEDFPQVKEPKVVLHQVLTDKLRKLLSQTDFSVCMQEGRSHIAGIYWQMDADQVRMVSTDGHRISEATALGGWGGSTLAVTLPLSALGEMKALFDASGKMVEVGIDGDHLHVGGSVGDGRIMLTVRTIQEAFPPYQKVIPTRDAAHVLVQRTDWLAALKRVAVVSASNAVPVRMAVAGGEMSLHVDNAAVGSGDEAYAVQGGAQDVPAFCLNARYVIDVLTAVDADDIDVEVGGALEPVVVRTEGFVGVIMPMNF